MEERICVIIVETNAAISCRKPQEKNEKEIQNIHTTTSRRRRKIRKKEKQKKFCLRRDNETNLRTNKSIEHGKSISLSKADYHKASS